VSAEASKPLVNPGRGTLLAYGFPGLPLAAVGLPLYIFLPAFYHESLGLSLGLVGALLLLARFWDVLTDPVIGTLTDYHGSRMGRRKPWMLAGTPLFMIGVWFLMVPPDGAGAWHLMGWSLVAYLGWTMIQLPYLALGAELSGNYHQRSRISVYREGFVVVGTLAAVIIPGSMEEMGAPRAQALMVLAAGMVLTLPLAVGLLSWRVPEPARPSQSVIAWRQGLSLLVANRPFRRLLSAYLINGLANALPATLFILFATEVLGAGDRIGLLLIVYFLSAVVALPFWLMAARRFGKHRIWAVSMGWAALVFAFVPFLGEGDYHWFLLITVLTGFSLGVDQAIPASIQADVVDEDTAEGGGGRAGLYFGLWNMATKLAWALAVGLAFPILDLVGLESGTDNSDGALLTLGLLYGAAPVVAKLLVIPLVWNFPVTADRQASLQAQIQNEAGP